MTLWYYKEKRQKVPLSSKIVQRDFFVFMLTGMYPGGDIIPGSFQPS